MSSKDRIREAKEENKRHGPSDIIRPTSQVHALSRRLRFSRGGGEGGNAAAVIAQIERAHEPLYRAVTKVPHTPLLVASLPQRAKRPHNYISYVPDCYGHR